jgi:leucine-zipper of insertion element IS481
VLARAGVVEQRYRAVLEVLEEGASVTEVARRHGVTRQTVHEWLARYSAGGLAGLADRSSRPGSCPHQMPAATEARVVSMRRDHPEWGRPGSGSSWSVPPGVCVRREAVGGVRFRPRGVRVLGDDRDLPGRLRSRAGSLWPQTASPTRNRRPARLCQSLNDGQPGATGQRCDQLGDVEEGFPAAPSASCIRPSSGRRPEPLPDRTPRGRRDR